MARSFRKNPVVTLQQGDKPGTAVKAKRRANRHVRAADDVPDGAAFKKFSCSWDICDFKSWWANAPAKARRK